ncbi:hypothetical protein GWI33_020439 [Rhynchophorus ferrugineus]|uniref:Endonuclease/exonuclease/phosphatase domain-containing protein n=1 Tax=Rhynchophorus ferrugineus TaxID=354439 RepID=A0A834LZG4_RHYFE|nr:hypothetical protein GWI33_020439 [Rhynchophorus ferrugineus]
MARSPVMVNRALILREQRVNFEHFSSFSPSFTTQSSAGVAILIKQDLIYKEVGLITNLEAVAIKIYLTDRSVTNCILQLAPSAVVTEKELEELLTQLSQPILIVVDFNAHAPEWFRITTVKKVE